MPIMPEILEIPEMSIILTRRMDVSVFSDESDRSEEGGGGFGRKRKISEEGRERFW